MKYQSRQSPQSFQTPQSRQFESTTSVPRIRRVIMRALGPLLVASVVLSACGSDGEPVSAGSDDTEETAESDTSGNDITDPASDSLDDDSGDTTQDRDENGDLKDYEEALADPGSDPSSDYIQPIDEPLPADVAAEWARLVGADVVAPSDIVDPKPWEIVEAFAISADDTEVIVRYTAGNPPCTQSRAEVTETDSAIEISLEVGLHPNVAAMSCLAGTSDTEIVVPLDGPVGDREIIAAQP